MKIRWHFKKMFPKKFFSKSFLYPFFPSFFLLSDTQTGVELFSSVTWWPKIWVITRFLPCHPLQKHKWSLLPCPHKNYLLNCSGQKENSLLKRRANSFSKPFPLQAPPSLLSLARGRRKTWATNSIRKKLGYRQNYKNRYGLINGHQSNPLEIIFLPCPFIKIHLMLSLDLEKAVTTPDLKK